jgi:hypothetical protein
MGRAKFSQSDFFSAALAIIAETWAIRGNGHFYQ